MNSIKDLKLSENDKNYIDLIINLLNKGQNKENLAIQIKPIVEEYSYLPTNGLINGLMLDLQCHIGLYSSNKLDYRFKGREYTFNEGVEYVLDRLKLVREQSNFELPDDIYERYVRWIVLDNENIEVEVLFSEHWNYDLLKDIAKDDYYFDLVINVSFASFSKTVKVDNNDNLNLEKAINEKDKLFINSLADKIRDNYFKEHY